MPTVNIRIAGTGRYIPDIVVPNEAFKGLAFYSKENELLQGDNDTLIKEIARKTGISSRRHCEPDKVASDIGFIAAKAAIEDAGITPDQLTGILCCSNVGDVEANGFGRMDNVPSLASRIKEKLETPKPRVYAFDLGGGCAGWLMGVDDACSRILAYYTRHKYDKRNPQRILVIGAETLSRVSDLSDIHSMTYSDGAGAVVVEAFRSNKRNGIMEPAVKTYAHGCRDSVFLGPSNQYGFQQEGELFIKTRGSTVMERALQYSPGVIKAAIKSAKLKLKDIDIFLFPQTNEKFNWAVAKRLFDGKRVPKDKFPMILDWLPNPSTATHPILLDLLRRGEMEGYEINPGNKVLFYSLGAGINIAAFVYKVPE